MATKAASKKKGNESEAPVVAKPGLNLFKKASSQAVNAVKKQPGTIVQLPVVLVDGHLDAPSERLHSAVTRLIESKITPGNCSARSTFALHEPEPIDLASRSMC